MKNLLSLETNKYDLKLDNFEGPLDLLVYLIDKNKMDIYEVKISDIAEQYINYLREQEELNLEIASEFVVMASTLVLLKSKSLLPKDVEDEAELTEEELLRRIIEYKKYKEISKLFKENINEYSKRFYKLPDKVNLPKQKIEKEFKPEDIIEKYRAIVIRNENKKNENAKNIEKIAIHDTYTVADKVKDIFRELAKRPKFVFGSLFKLSEKPKAEVVTAFSGVLELSRRNKVNTSQKELFGDIVVSKRPKMDLPENSESLTESDYMSLL